MKRFALVLIKIYQNTLSRVNAPACRFVPSCSQYTYEAITRYGIFKGVGLGMWRLLKCHPLHPGGYDPVP